MLRGINPRATDSCHRYKSYTNEPAYGYSLHSETNPFLTRLFNTYITVSLTSSSFLRKWSWKLVCQHFPFIPYFQAILVVLPLYSPTNPTMSFRVPGVTTRCKWSGMKQYANTDTPFDSASVFSWSRKAHVSALFWNKGVFPSVQIVIKHIAPSRA